MISDVHPADGHAPYPHRMITGSGVSIRRDPENRLARIEVPYSFAHVVCAICGHGAYARPGCKCRASCHAVYQA